MSEKEDASQKPDTVQLDDKALEKLAVEELMREAVQGAARAEIVGPAGWIKSQPHKTNKRFLVNTLRSAVNSNKYNYSKRHRRSKDSPKRDKRSDSSNKKDKKKH